MHATVVVTAALKPRSTRRGARTTAGTCLRESRASVRSEKGPQQELGGAGVLVPAPPLAGSGGHVDARRGVNRIGKV